ncbi:hypothetical protein [Moraxella lacunata]
MINNIRPKCHAKQGIIFDNPFGGTSITHHQSLTITPVATAS